MEALSDIFTGLYFLGIALFSLAACWLNWMRHLERDRL